MFAELGRLFHYCGIREIKSVVTDLLIQELPVLARDRGV